MRMRVILSRAAHSATGRFDCQVMPCDTKMAVSSMAEVYLALTIFSIVCLSCMILVMDMAAFGVHGCEFLSALLVSGWRDFHAILLSQQTAELSKSKLS